MVVDTAAEVAEAMGVPSEELAAMTNVPMDASVPGGGTFTYQVSDPDKESWRPAWKLEKGMDGLEYGKPIKLPKDPAALARYLAKRRPMDGGRLFTLTMPERIAPMGQFECFVAPDSCRKRVSKKGVLLDHMEACHPAESRHYAPFLKEIRDSIAAENPALARIVKQISETPDSATVAVPEALRIEHDATVPVIPEAEPAMTFSVNYDCTEPGCDWKPKPGTTRAEFARQLHIKAKHTAPEEAAELAAFTAGLE